MKPEDIIKATRNSLNIYSFTAEALEKLIAAIQSEHKCQTCEALARTVMMDQTAHDTQTAAQRQWVGLTDEEIEMVYAVTVKTHKKTKMPPTQLMFARTIQEYLKSKNT